MLNEKLLGTLLRSLQTYADLQDTPRLLSTAASLLVSLNNPQNVTLLSSQLLLAPALWTRPDGLSTCLSFMSLFHSAALAKARADAGADTEASERYNTGLGKTTTSDLKLRDWIQAIVKGADDRSPRWRHAILLGGLLVGIRNQEALFIPASLDNALSGGLVRSVNLALEAFRQEDPFPGSCLALVLAQCYTDLPEREQARLNYDRLLPVLLGAALYSSDGFQSGYFVGVVDADISQEESGKLKWPINSTSHIHVEKMASSPLVSSMGPLATIIAHAIESVNDAWLVRAVLEDILKFTAILSQQWRMNKLSAVEHAEKSNFIDHDTINGPLSSLWKLFKSILFTIVVVLKGILAYALSRKMMAIDSILNSIAAQVLSSLGNLYFIYLRIQNQSFSLYSFVYLTSLDIITNDIHEAGNFINEISPKTLGQYSQHPLERIRDLYFLNTAEHFTLTLSPEMNNDVLVAAASPYLSTEVERFNLQIFEAAHSIILAVLSAPCSAHLITWRILPFYTESLFRGFPRYLSPRQFRFAIKTVIRISTPPAPFSVIEPDFADILLDSIYGSATPKEPALGAAVARLEANEHIPASAMMLDGVHLSEQAVLVLALTDALPYLSYDQLQDWLPRVAQAIGRIENDAMRDCCIGRFWAVMTEGEMDVERSRICAIWWGTKGGRESVLFGKGKEREMNGDERSGIGETLPTIARESKL